MELKRDAPFKSVDELCRKKHIRKPEAEKYIRRHHPDWIKKSRNQNKPKKYQKITLKQGIARGEFRKKYGLDSSSGSQYDKLRKKGFSDEDAQYQVLKNRGLLDEPRGRRKEQKYQRRYKQLRTQGYWKEAPRMTRDAALQRAQELRVTGNNATAVKTPAGSYVVMRRNKKNVRKIKKRARSKSKSKSKKKGKRKK